MTEVHIQYPLIEDKSVEEQVELRHIVQEAIEASGIGEVTASGCGRDQMDITVEVQNSDEAATQLGKLFETLSIPNAEID